MTELNSARRSGGAPVVAEIVDLALAVEATGRLSGSRLACFWHLDRERPALRLHARYLEDDLSTWTESDRREILEGTRDRGREAARRALRRTPLSAGAASRLVDRMAVTLESVGFSSSLEPQAPPETNAVSEDAAAWGLPS